MVETSAGAYAQNEIQWNPWLRTLAGIRADGYRFNVDAANPLNGGVASAVLISPKGGVIVGPFKGTELYMNAGNGFHSNDARGATITVDPLTGEAAHRVTPLVRATGAEAGVRTVVVPHLQTTFTVWSLELASELVFRGRGHDGSRPAEPPGRDRARQLLQSAPMADVRRRRFAVARAIHRRRCRRRPNSRARSKPSSRRARRSTQSTTFSEASVCGTSGRAAHRGQLGQVEGLDPRESGRLVTGSRME